jgi:putative endonuclease
MKYFVYILYSESADKYYIGQTYDLNIRLLRHKLKTTHFTKQADDWKVVYSEDFKTRAEAMNREKFIKKQKSRKYIAELIDSAG